MHIIHVLCSFVQFVYFLSEVFFCIKPVTIVFLKLSLRMELIGNIQYILIMYMVFKEWQALLISVMNVFN